MTAPIATWGAPAHLAWLDAHRADLLAFYAPEVRRAKGGFHWLDNAGHPVPGQGQQLWIGARMVHVFSIAHLLGHSGAAEIARHGLDHYTTGAGRDHEHGGWFNAVMPDHIDDRKELYGHAHMLLAGSSAAQAGLPGGEALAREASELIDRHFWIEADGACLDSLDRAFGNPDSYRGLNGNMHLTEAYLAAYEAFGEDLYLERALRLAQKMSGAAASGDHRLPEHFDSSWTPILDYNRDVPNHPFRPYGSTVGHWLEWAKLDLQLWGLTGESWLLDAARPLVEGAFADGWHEPGFVYTVDWDGTPVVDSRFFWPMTEAAGALHWLALATGEDRWKELYAQVWDRAQAHFVDTERGGWHSEVDGDGRPVAVTWDGKPDLYHVFQATLYAHLPVDRGLAAWATLTSGR